MDRVNAEDSDMELLITHMCLLLVDLIRITKLNLCLDRAELDCMHFLKFTANGVHMLS